MRIGLDCRTTEGLAGVAQYGRHLAEPLVAAPNGDEFVIFRNAPKRLPFWTAHISDRSRFLRAKLGLLHVLGGAAPIGYRHPYVLTVHDLAIYKHPEWFPEDQWFSTRVSYPSSIKLARHIIVPSIATKKDLLDLFKVKEEKIAVIPHGVSATPQAARVASSEKYILFIGTIEPRKNVSTLVKAYRLMIDRYPELKEFELRLAGAVGWRADGTVDEIRKTQCEGYRISLLGPVSEEEKWRQLSNASCFVYPSLYEGFGLPVLEAMASGTPVVCSDNTSLSEVAGTAALFARAQDIEGWAEKVAAVLTDKKTAGDMRTKGAARASEFSWEKSAEETRRVYKAVTASR
jgi:glycosyltransferase involved in cell wall biosynthesis